METVTEVKANGQDKDVAIQGSSGYPFDAAQLEIQVPVGRGLLVTHVFAKPDLDDHLNREKATLRRTLVAKDGESTPDSNVHEANGTFYDNLILSAFAHKVGSTDHVKDYTQDEAKRFTFEAKNKALGQMYSSTFSIDEDDDDPLAHLFENSGTVVVKQEFEESYVIKYTMKLPTKPQRLDYLDGVKVRQKVEKKNRQVLRTEYNWNKGVKLFNALFESVEGGRIETGEFSPELKGDFLKAIDAMYMSGVVDVLVGYFDKASD